MKVSFSRWDGARRPAMTDSGYNDTSAQPQTHAMGAARSDPGGGEIPMKTARPFAVCPKATDANNKEYRCRQIGRQARSENAAMLGALQDFATQHGTQFAKNGFLLFAEVAARAKLALFIRGVVDK